MTPLKFMKMLEIFSHVLWSHYNLYKMLKYSYIFYEAIKIQQKIATNIHIYFMMPLNLSKNGVVAKLPRSPPIAYINCVTNEHQLAVSSLPTRPNAIG